MTFKPMLASPMEEQHVRWPMFASVKLDGVRAVVRNGQLLSRSLKLIPNQSIQAALAKPAFDGLDGELIIGPANSPTCYRDTVSGVMSEDKQDLDWYFHVFDKVMDAPFKDRFEMAEKAVHKMGSRVLTLPQTLVHDVESLNTFESAALQEGHEGVILRGPASPYKYGRSTAREGYLLKVKRFVDGEAEVLEVIEELHNGNEATTNELGRTKRSSHKENKTGKGRMGALLVKDIKTGVEFQIGTGFDDSDKDWWWDKHLERQRTGSWYYARVKYKSFPIGVKDKPRHPVYLGTRDPRDM